MPPDGWAAHRRLIRATLPKTETASRRLVPIPEFTMHQRPPSRGFGGRGFRHGHGQGNGGHHGNGFRPNHGNGTPSRDGEGPDGNVPRSLVEASRRRPSPASPPPRSVLCRDRPRLIAMTQGAFAGKVGLVVGVANKRSLSWAIAQARRRQGASLALTLSGRAARRKRARAVGAARRSADPAVRRDQRRADGCRLRGDRREARRPGFPGARRGVRRSRRSGAAVLRNVARRLSQGARHQRVSRCSRSRGGPRRSWTSAAAAAC